MVLDLSGKTQPCGTQGLPRQTFLKGLLDLHGACFWARRKLQSSIQHFSGGILDRTPHHVIVDAAVRPCLTACPSGERERGGVKRNRQGWCGPQAKPRTRPCLFRFRGEEV
jgi:hypothetical protein